MIWKSNFKSSNIENLEEKKPLLGLFSFLKICFVLKLLIAKFGLWSFFNMATLSQNNVAIDHSSKYTRGISSFAPVDRKVFLLFSLQRINFFLF